MYTVYLTDYNATPNAWSTTLSSEKLYIYDPLTQDEGYGLVDPTLSIQANKAGTFSASIPRTNYGHNTIIKGRTRAVVEKDNKIIFMGRINEVESDIYDNQNFTTEGALSYLNDSLTGKKIYTYMNLYDLLEVIFTNHNSKFTEPYKKFNIIKPGSGLEEQYKAKFVGYDDTDANSDKLASYKVNYDVTMEIVIELVDLANGALKIQYNETTGGWDVYVYNKYSFPVNDSQPITIGLNLIDSNKSDNTNEIATVVAPFGGDLQYVKSKEIGDFIAGVFYDTEAGRYRPYQASSVSNWEADKNNETNWYEQAIYVRNKDSVELPYNIYSAQSEGYWVFRLNIATYNTNHPDAPLKKLYISWKGYEFETNSQDACGEGYIEDCAWRVYDSVGDSIGYRKFDATGIEGAIDEVIDLSEPQYIGATTVVVSGFSDLIIPQIRRDAIIVDDNDRLNISGCDAFEHASGFTHEAGSVYLQSDALVEQYGVIEKKLEYDISDSPVKVSNWPLPNANYNGVLGTAYKHDQCYLGYDAGDGTDLDTHKGDYHVIPNAGAGYWCIEYTLPDVGNKNRPRGVFISCRMHTIGVVQQGGGNWMVNGLYAIFDPAHQLMAYKSAEQGMFTSIKDEYIDLSDAKYYGAKYILVGGWGGDIPANAVPSDDAYGRDLLLAQAMTYLSDYQWSKLVIEASAVDLSITSEEYESFDICTNVQTSVTVGRAMMYQPITGLEIHLDEIESSRVKIGYDNDEYMSTQMAQSKRVLAVEKTVEEKRRSKS